MRHVVPDAVQEVYNFTTDEVRRLQMIADAYGLTIAQCFHLSQDMNSLLTSHASRTMAPWEVFDRKQRRVKR